MNTMISNDESNFHNKAPSLLLREGLTCSYTSRTAPECLQRGEGGSRKCRIELHRAGGWERSWLGSGKDREKQGRGEQPGPRKALLAFIRPNAVMR